MKIAVVFSAESRTFNSNSAAEWLSWKNKIEENYDIEFTFYGHTWDHCPDHEIPNSEILPLSDVWIDSENIISDWICESYMPRVYFSRTDTYIGKIDPNNDATKIKFIDEMLFHSRRHWGQHVSGFLSFKNIPENQRNQFDGFIKARWDSAPILIDSRLDSTVNDIIFDLKVKNLIDFFNSTGANFGSNVSGTGISEKPGFSPQIDITPNDVVFFMTTQAVRNFTSSRDVVSFMNKIEELNSHGLTAHSLWATIFSYHQICYKPDNDVNPMPRFKIVRPPNYQPKEYKYF